MRTKSNKLNRRAMTGEINRILLKKKWDEGMKDWGDECHSWKDHQDYFKEWKMKNNEETQEWIFFF